MGNILKLRDDGLLATTNIKEESNILTTGTIVISSPNYLLIEGGSSFPQSPTSGTLFYRSDEKKYYYYNGTTWLEVAVTTPPNTLNCLGAPWSPLRIDNYFTLPPFTTNNMFTNLTLTANTIYLFPVTFSRLISIKGLAIFKTNTTTGSLQLGVYSNTLRLTDRMDVPNTLLASNTVTLLSSTGFYAVRIESELRAYETYWIALVTPTIGVRIYSTSAQYTTNFLGVLNGSTPVVYYSTPGNSLPSTLVDAAFNKNYGNCPIVYATEVVG